MEKNEVFSHTSYFIINKNNEIVSLRNAKKIIKFQNLFENHVILVFQQ